MTRKSAVFLDRDGVLIEEVGFLSDPERVVLIPGAAAAVRRLNRDGVPVVVVTNQSGIARGLFTIDDHTAVQQRLQWLLAAEGAHIDGTYCCPHHPRGRETQYAVLCSCRKPAPGMLLQAADELGVELRHSWMVGDRLSDLEAGSAAGCRTILVRTGYGKDVRLPDDCRALELAAVSASIVEAIDYLTPYIPKLRLAA